MNNSVTDALEKEDLDPKFFNNTILQTSEALTGDGCDG